MYIGFLELNRVKKELRVIKNKEKLLKLIGSIATFGSKSVVLLQEKRKRRVDIKIYQQELLFVY